MQPDWFIKTDPRLLAAIRRAAQRKMIKAEIDAQRRSWVRAMTPITRRERAEAFAHPCGFSDKSTTTPVYAGQGLRGGSLKGNCHAE